MNIIELVVKNDYKTLKKNIHNLNVNESDDYYEHDCNALFHVSSYKVTKLLIDNGINVNHFLYFIYKSGSASLWSPIYWIYDHHNLSFIDTDEAGEVIKLILYNGYNINLDMMVYASMKKWRVFPFFDRSLLDNPIIQQYKSRFLFIDDPLDKTYLNVFNVDKPYQLWNYYCHDEVYKRLRKYFNVNTDEEVDLIIGEL